MSVCVVLRCLCNFKLLPMLSAQHPFFLWLQTLAISFSVVTECSFITLEYVGESLEGDCQQSKRSKYVQGVEAFLSECLNNGFEALVCICECKYLISESSMLTWCRVVPLFRSNIVLQIFNLCHTGHDSSVSILFDGCNFSWCFFFFSQDQFWLVSTGCHGTCYVG